MYKYIDLTTYPRRTHFEFFKTLAFPYVGFTQNVDVTNLIHAAKKRNGSTFLACLYAIATAANRVPELRQRIQGDEIIEFDHCNTGHTVAMPDRTFCNCQTDCRRSFDEFLVYGNQRQEEAKKNPGFINPDEDGDSMIFVSCVPWITFTQVIQPVPSPADSVPRVVTGKYIEDGDKILMPLEIQANHALVDGWHLSEFYREFDEIVQSIE